jgi:hypothetical protein
MDQGAAQGELLLHPSRQGPRPAFLEGLDLAIDIGDELVVLFDRRIEDRREELEVLLDAQVLIEGEAPRHVADPFRIALKSFDDVEAVDASRSRRRRGGA